MFPTMERRSARSMYSSVRRFPSWTARRVSVTPALTTMRFPTANLDPGSRRGTRPAMMRLVELPHSDRDQETQCSQGDHHGRSAVAHERQRNPHDGEQARHHANVDQDLDRKYARHPEGQDAPPGLPRAGRDLEPPQYQERVGHDQHETPQEPPHLREHGKNEISVPLGEKGQPALRRAADAFPQE